MPRRRRPPLRQFECSDCPRRWWAREDGDDPVSGCRRCGIECEALLPEEESGWAKFECECGNEFSGYATLINPAESPCYVCGTNCAPERVLRFSNHRPSKSENSHSCTGVNCYNRVPGIPAMGECVHPKSKRIRHCNC